MASRFRTEVKKTKVGKSEWTQNPADPAVHSFIHSGHFYSAPSSPLLLRGAPDYSMDTVSEIHAGQATAGKGLAQGLYVAARAGVEPTTLRLNVIVSTKAPPHPTAHYINVSNSLSLSRKQLS